MRPAGTGTEGVHTQTEDGLMARGPFLILLKEWEKNLIKHGRYSNLIFCLLKYWFAQVCVLGKYLCAEPAVDPDPDVLNFVLC